MQHIIFLTSPLEQFSTNPIFPILGYLLDFSFTTGAIVFTLISLFSVLFVCSLIKPNSFTYYIIPNSWQYAIERLNLLIISLVTENVKDKKAQSLIPLVYFVFHFNLLMNMFGLIPYSFTITSHIIVTFFMALVIFIGIQIIGVRKHNIHYFCMLLPPDTSTTLAFLLVPIEFLSFISKPISLAIRLFANMMAGHTLLKVIAGFSSTMISCGGLMVLWSYVPMLVLLILIYLEAVVAMIQTFVFSILIAIYLNEALNLH
jgi:ATP synthase subunit 6